MNVVIREVKAKSILSRSGIPGADYCINPYTGCAHGCRYCYATFMKKYTGHTEEWGSFVDVKINAPELLQRQMRRAKTGSVMISSVTDAYQSLEAEYKVTRQCLEILLQYQFPVSILTKSPLVLRDMDIISTFRDVEVGLTITTEDDRMRRIFEPTAPSIEARISALRALHSQGIRTYAFIGPVLPMNPEAVLERLSPYVSYVLIDRMNYVSKTLPIFHRLKLTRWLDAGFTGAIVERLKRGFSEKAVSVCQP